MTDARGTARWRRSVPALLAVLLAAALSVAAPSAPPAAAASTLEVGAAATYTLDPDARAVHVEIALTATSLQPSSGQYVYFFRELRLAVQPSATGVRAADDGGSLRVTTARKAGYVDATVQLRSKLYYRQSAALTLRYELPAGAPRSDSPTRVGKAFSSFGIWAWGDPGASTVEVRLPRGFSGEVLGGPLTRAAGDGAEVYSAKPADPFGFFAYITAENASAYATSRISLDGGVEVVVLSWPEDRAWQSSVRDVLSRGIPELQRLIGLTWPVERDLRIREWSTPLLEGYAGVFLRNEQRIDVTEDLDPMVIVHETSHAWFNGDLFDGRWIDEGLADEYAWQVLHRLGKETPPTAERPLTSDPGYGPLREWQHPRVIRDQETDDSEAYGYNAAWFVIHQVYQAAGEQRLRDAFAAAAHDTIAYPGAGAPERVAPQDDWRRFLDLVEDPTRVEPAAIEDAFRTLVLRPSEGKVLQDRAAARARYRDLLAAGDDWLPPLAVRRLLGEWQFTRATTAMDEATAVLALRDAIAARARALGLQAGGRLEAAYESASTGLDEATSIANAELDALAALADARAKLDAPVDVVSQLGLIGRAPEPGYAAAVAAFQAGDLTAARDGAVAAAAIVTGAAALGRERLLIGGVVAVLVLLLLVQLALVLRRRRARRPLDGAAALAVMSPLGDEAAPSEPYATLAPHPDAPPAAEEPSEPEVEGGPASGASPAQP